MTADPRYDYALVDLTARGRQEPSEDPPDGVPTDGSARADGRRGRLPTVPGFWFDWPCSIRALR